MLIQFIVAAVFICAGIFVFAAATFGVFRFHYVLNRMHIAAQCDTIGCVAVHYRCDDPFRIYLHHTEVYPCDCIPVGSQPVGLPFDCEGRVCFSGCRG